MNLADLKNGEKGIILKVRGRGAFRKRIIEMGFVVGKQVIVVKNAPLKDPIEYNIMGYEVSLRRSEAALIEVTTHSNGKTNKEYQGVLEIEQSLNLAPINPRKKIINVAFVGNPNCGKTTIFNLVTHSNEKVGNYGGITVDAKKSRFTYKGFTFNVVDLPGTYSITSYTPEELYVRDHIVNELPDVVVNVIDTSNLERNLYLTTQLIDMDIKVVAALNMWDEFLEKGHKFDYRKLSRMLGIPMVPTVGSKDKGVNELFDKVISVYNDKEPDIRHIHINYGNMIEGAIKKLQDVINECKNTDLTHKVAPRYLAIKILEEDEKELQRIEQCNNAEDIKRTGKEQSAKIEDCRNDSVETVITDAKYGFIEGALKETLHRGSNIQDKLSRSRLIDNIVTSKFMSYPVFLFVIWLTFQSTFFIGDYPMRWIEMLVAFTGEELNSLLPDGMIKDMLVEGILGGVGGVIVFLPNILILFFFLTLMEASGYMARVAFIVDKIMHKVGLHGKSFVPMLMGFGCNVPAIMATRTIESKNDRLVTMLIIPFMSCSARYPVYILLINAFFSSYRGTILFGIYLFGILLAGIVALILRKTLFKVQTVPFVMELPPYRKPVLKSVLKQTWFKGEQYLKKMGTIILVASLIVWALGYFPRNTKDEKLYAQKIETLQEQITQNQNTTTTAAINDSISVLNAKRLSAQQEGSFIGIMGKYIEPIIRPLGFDWKMGIGLIAGGAAKEIVVSTLGVLYQTNELDNENHSLSERLTQQVYDSGPRKGQPVFTPLVALSFMLFILIYFPCIAVVAAIKNESGQWKWSVFLAAYTTGLAYVVSLLVYQIGSLFV